MSKIDLSMTSDRPGVAEDDGRQRYNVPSGTTVTYIGHGLLGMVRVRFDDGTICLMHPHCFPTLRDPLRGP